MLFSCEILLSFFIHKNSQKTEMESTDSSTGSQQPQLPPGFRFHPTDEELVVHYLKKKVASVPLPVSIIAEVDLYKFDPWELPAKAAFGEQEWYFFSPRDRKYPNGARPNRAATSGYWKATGTDKPVLTSGGTQKVGVKKALVFYRGKPPKGNKTDWIMHEYRLADGKTNNKPPGCDISKRGSLRLDDWVLCRIYKKNTPRPLDHERDELNINDHHHHHHHMMNPSLVASSLPPSIPFQGLKSSAASTYGALLENEPHMFEGMMGSTSGHHQLTSSSQNSGKRTLPGLYWNDEGAANSNSPTTKRFLSESDGNLSRGNEHDQNNASIATLLSQLPQAQNSLHQQAMLGSLGDGVFRQPYQVSGMNWYG